MMPLRLSALAVCSFWMLSVPANAQATQSSIAPDDTNPKTKAKLSSQLGGGRPLLDDLQISKWFDQGVIYIISSEEAAVFAVLQTEEERREFFVDFWLRRDPTPDTDANEYRDEHYRRVAYANAHFATRIPGWTTKRGMVYVKFGPPDKILTRTESGMKVETWRYGSFLGTEARILVDFEIGPDGEARFRSLQQHDFFSATYQQKPPAGSGRGAINYVSCVRRINMCPIRDKTPLPFATGLLRRQKPPNRSSGGFSI